MVNLFRIDLATEQDKAISILSKAVCWTWYLCWRELDFKARAGLRTGFLTAHRTEVLQFFLEELDEKFFIANLKEEGRGELLAEMITKKIAKGKTLEQIVEELEEEVENIRSLYEELVAAVIE